MKKQCITILSMMLLASTLHAGRFELESPDLVRSMIPSTFTCDGIDVSSSLYWRGVRRMAQNPLL